MKKIRTLAIVSAMLLSSLLVPSMLPEVKAGSSQHGGTAPDDLVIKSVAMSDYNLRCRALGGDVVDICVEVKNQGSQTITEDFYVYIFVDQVTYIDKKPVKEDISPGKVERVHFYKEEINAEIGDHTLDAYINDDGSTRNYCNFRVTLFGIGAQ